ncbi:brix domain-containing protein ZK795.3 [Rosa chinensis]|uniref:brix domain-containing protein ZK795.3 n=1 Tax=Rosa chinensis TaxID=74649 RepID=UPI001AD8A294|nr:brix domain-containing protein ZK795.3 [Rosa chinensis]
MRSASSSAVVGTEQASELKKQIFCTILRNSVLTVVSPIAAVLSVSRYLACWKQCGELENYISLGHFQEAKGLSFANFRSSFLLIVSNFLCSLICGFLCNHCLGVAYIQEVGVASLTNQVISEIVESCRAHDYTDVVLVHEHRGKPDGLIVCHLPYGPTAYFQLCNVVSRHDIKDKKAMGTVPQAYPHLIINNFTTKLGERTANILKHLFPVPKPDTKRIITFSNEQDYISFRHHIYDKPGGPKSIELKEIGPRFELKLFKIKLGTVDQNEAQNEWVLKSYMNTASKKQNFIGN